MPIYILAYNNGQHFKGIKQHLLKRNIYTEDFLIELVSPCCELIQFHCCDIKIISRTNFSKPEEIKISSELQQRQ